MAVRRQIIQETQIYHFRPEKLRIGGELVKKGKVSSTKTTVLGNKFPKGGIPVSLLRWPSFSDTIVRYFEPDWGIPSKREGGRRKKMKKGKKGGNGERWRRGKGRRKKVKKGKERDGKEDWKGHVSSSDIFITAMFQRGALLNPDMREIIFQQMLTTELTIYKHYLHGMGEVMAIIANQTVTRMRNFQ